MYLKNLKMFWGRLNPSAYKVFLVPVHMKCQFFSLFLFLSKQFKIFVLCHHMILCLCFDVFWQLCMIYIKVFIHCFQSFVCLSVLPSTMSVLWKVHYLCKIVAFIQCLWTRFMSVTYWSRSKSELCYQCEKCTLHHTEESISEWI
jgi:hypothetical protein